MVGGQPHLDPSSGGSSCGDRGYACSTPHCRVSARHMQCSLIVVCRTVFTRLCARAPLRLRLRPLRRAPTASNKPVWLAVHCWASMGLPTAWGSRPLFMLVTVHATALLSAPKRLCSPTRRQSFLTGLNKDNNTVKAVQVAIAAAMAQVLNPNNDDNGNNDLQEPACGAHGGYGTATAAGALRRAPNPTTRPASRGRGAATQLPAPLTLEAQLIAQLHSSPNCSGKSRRYKPRSSG